MNPFAKLLRWEERRSNDSWNSPLNAGTASQPQATQACPAGQKIWCQETRVMRTNLNSTNHPSCPWHMPVNRKMALWSMPGRPSYCLYSKKSNGKKKWPVLRKVTPRAAVLIVQIDLNDRFFKLVVTLPDDKISDRPHLLNPEIDGSPYLASTWIPFCALRSL